MMKANRLFDCLDKLLKEMPNDPLLVAKEGGKWRPYTSKEVADIVEKLAAGLLCRTRVRLSAIILVLRQCLPRWLKP